MADIIQLLPDSIANQIAAGEVIQRPASVVKELLENAVDAGSTSIQLIVKDAGRTLIQVVDDGRGMSVTDARMCFERHATSKIRDIHDIFSIYTMGFRGEAMASIAAVAQVELKSRQESDKVGTSIRIEGSRIISQEPCTHHAGSTIIVKNLFFNVPARRNFLKSNQVELKHVMDEFIRIALAHPHLGFSLHHNGSELFHLKQGNLRQRILGLFGKNLNEQLVPVDEATDYVSVSGFIGKPDISRKTRGEQFFFVNNRFIKSPFLNYAVAKAYEALIPDKAFPFYVLFIQISPAAIDVNVHPTKQEIKFEDEKSIFMIIQAAVKHGLAQYSVTPTLDFDKEASLEQLPSFNQVRPVADERIMGKFSGGHRFEPARSAESYRPGTSGNDWKSIIPPSAAAANDIITLRSRMDSEELPNPHPSLFDDAEKMPFEPVQLHQRFIMTQIKSGFVLIDQQLASERIRYEMYLNMLDQSQSATQQSLFPKTLNFSPQDSFLMQEIMPELRSLGFDIQPFGQNTFVVHGMPADHTEENEQSLIEGLLERYKSSFGGESLTRKERLAQSLARQTAIKKGQRLEPKEMKSVIEELFVCKEPNVTPGGKATFITIHLQDIEQRFT
jgi:DNA mismatch repair protein MutL